MLELICYLMPSFIALNIHKYINKETDKTNLFIYYGIYCTLVNLLSLLAVAIKHRKSSVSFDMMITPSFCVKYIMLSILLSIVLPYVIKIIKNNIAIDIEVKRNEKKEKANK